MFSFSLQNWFLDDIIFLKYIYGDGGKQFCVVLQGQIEKSDRNKWDQNNVIPSKIVKTVILHMKKVFIPSQKLHTPKNTLSEIFL